MDIWKFLSGQDPKGVHGMKMFVDVQHLVDIWKYLNMQDPKGVRGMKEFVVMQQ